MIFEELNKETHQDDVYKANPHAWLLSLIDLISLIFSFFVLMYSTKEISQEKYDEIKDSFVKYITGDKKLNLQYQYVPKPINENFIVKKAIDMNYLENVFKNSLEGHSDIKLTTGNSNGSISVQIEESYDDLNDLNRKISERLILLSKSTSPISNQIQVIAYASDLDASAAISELVSKKLIEFGYEKNIMRTLPENSVTENLEKDKNKVRIDIVINTYEAIF